MEERNGESSKEIINVIRLCAAVCATGPYFDNPIFTRSLDSETSVPSRKYAILLTSDEVQSLGEHATQSFLIRSNNVVSRHLPMPLRHIPIHDYSQPSAEAPPLSIFPEPSFLSLFWPELQTLRAAFGLPFRQIIVAFPNVPQDVETLCHATCLHPSTDFHALASQLRNLLRFPKIPDAVFDAILHLAHSLSRSNFSTAELAETVVVAHLRRHKTENSSQSLDVVNVNIENWPHHVPLYLHRAALLITLCRFDEALRDVWFSALTLEPSQSVRPRIVKLLTKLYDNLLHIGLDVIFRPLSEKGALHPVTYSCGEMDWASLSDQQRKTHHRLISQAFQLSSHIAKRSLSFHHPPPAKLHALVSCRSLTERMRDSTKSLPRNFSFFLSPHLAACAAPESVDNIKALSEAGFSLVISLCDEVQLPSSWFSRTSHLLPITNEVIAFPDHHAPSFPQIDAIVASLAANSSGRSLIHCRGGKGRTGTVLACLAIAFGNYNTIEIPPLCEHCTTMFSQRNLTRLFIGGCVKDSCALAMRPQLMTAEHAVETVRLLRPPSVEKGEQERFVNAWVSELWKRNSLFSSDEGSTDRLSLLYPALSPSEKGLVQSKLCIKGVYPQGRQPRLIVLCGLPGSGKSYVSDLLAKCLRRHEKVVVVSQDELGSRAVVSEAVSNAAQDTNNIIIVDRVNAMKTDRSYWFQTAFKPMDSVVLHMTTPADVCIARAKLRINHKTLQPAMAEGIIQGIAKGFQPPGEAEIREGFSAVFKFNFECNSEELVSILGGRVPNSTSGTSLEESLISQPISPHSRGDCSQTDIAETKAVDFVRPIHRSEFLKFPRTRHLFFCEGTHITADDLVLSDEHQLHFLSTLDTVRTKGPCNNGELRVTLEEKVDGANLGFSVDACTGELRAQNRSHYVTSRSHAQFNKLQYYMKVHEEELKNICEYEGRRYVLYGEWVYMTHSISYTKLPSPFLAFDLLDVNAGRFLSRKRFHEILDNTEIDTVPEIQSAIPSDAKSFSNLLSSVSSRFGTNVGIEGVYIRVDRGDWLVDRAKVVRQDFTPGNNQWSRGPVLKNSYEHI